MHEHMVTMDPPDHTRERALLMRLITPKRLKDNEAFMWRLADQQLDEFVADGHCEFITAYAQPFAMLVVADLLGVPEEEHQRFREGFGLQPAPSARSAPARRAARARTRWRGSTRRSPRYIEDRRREPRKDVLTDLALGHLPRRLAPRRSPSVVRTATFLFAAGQETTARLLAAALKHLAEHPELQDELRADRDRIPDFLEEVLRIESPVKTDFRLAQRDHDDRRRRHPGRHAGDAAQRRRQPRPPPLRVPRTSSSSTGPTPRPTSPSAAAPTRAPAARWPGPRAASASSASSTACATSACPRSTTARPATAASATSRPGSSAASPSCTSSSTPVGGRVDEPRRGRHRRRLRHRPRRRPRSSSADGHRVALLDRNGAAPRRPPPSSRPRARRAIGLEVDVADRAVRRRRVRAGPRRARPGRDPRHQRRHRVVRRRSLDITAETWDRIIAVNLTGTFTCVQAALPDMLAAGWGRIVTISSSSAQSGAPNMAHYAASKGGVISLTKALAVELARSGITVNTIAPSLVDTPMARAGRGRGRLPRRRRGRPRWSRSAGPARPTTSPPACSFLCSDGGSYITGQVLGVNGGMYI